MRAKFGGTCARCRRPFLAGTAILWQRDIGAWHEDTTACTLAVLDAPAPAPIPTIDLSGVVQLLTDARTRGGLKRPKARFLAPGGGELVLSIAGPTSKVPGSINVVVNNDWVGRVDTTGQVSPRLAANTALVDVLVTIASNPAEAAKAYGALMCQCSFCGLPLTDAGSVEVGYGPVCAKKWNLPHTAKGTPSVQALDPDMPLTYGPNAAHFLRQAGR
jgi:hypothetical protein